MLKLIPLLLLVQASAPRGTLLVLSGPEDAATLRAAGYATVSSLAERTTWIGAVVDIKTPPPSQSIQVPTLVLADVAVGPGAASPQFRRELMARNLRNQQILRTADLAEAAKAFFQAPAMPLTPHAWQRIGDGYNGCEGAQWIENNGEPMLLYSAHHDHFAFRWTEKGGLRVWRDDSPEATSFRPGPRNTFYVVEQGNRRLVRWDASGRAIEVLADRFEGKLLNRPNDVVQGPGNTLWFTDPNYLFRQRPLERQELEGQYVFRYHLRSKALSAPVRDLTLPNGIAVNATHLYIGDSGTQSIHRVAIHASGELASPLEVFAKLPESGLDGLAFDPDRRLWAAGREHVFIFNADGTVAKKLRMPSKPTSIAFFDGKQKWLAITARDCVYVAHYENF